jgi:hypothetical protein
MSSLPKAFFRVSTIPIKISMSFFIEMEEEILNFICNTKVSKWPKQSGKEKNLGTSHFQNVLKCNYNQNSIVLVYKHILTNDDTD